jgi:hypothetical protein
MSTTSVNPVVYGPFAGGLKQLHLPCANSTNPVNQGDLVYLDSSAHIVKPVDSDAHAASLAGVALQPSAPTSNIDNSSAPALPALMVGMEVVASLKTTASETYVTGTPVYIGADAQTITTVSATNKIGIVILPPAVSSVTGAAGVRVPVYIKSVAI